MKQSVLMLMKTHPHRFSYKPKQLWCPRGTSLKEAEVCVGLSWSSWLWEVVGFGSRKDRHTHTYIHTHTHVNKQGANMLKIIWEHQVLLFLKLSLFLYQPHPLCVSPGFEGLMCVVSCSNHRGVTRRLIHMQWDKPTSATNISVWPASKQGIFQQHTLSQSLTWKCTDVICKIIQLTPSLGDLIYHIRKHVCRTSQIKQRDALCVMWMSLTRCCLSVTEIISFVRAAQEVAVQRKWAPARNLNWIITGRCQSHLLSVWQSQPRPLWTSLASVS